ncbi:toxin ParE1/3/4 [Rhodoblastus acidophilus]|uniref:type II toxin-antitoxin system RelE/ParE family toxin n=1 Tax=Rhodoblastus acidophilus TaxID=1074 RepID=UPI0022257495|nr:type II toxin-antitoxin system RelE/ParE family toxin [Rhodoblastus acidophilus]MCW2317384.1 toxin ParE1/3/4 [Rhodoblastus acidophilus]
MNRLKITPRAAADLEDIADFIAREAPRAAVRLVERIQQTARLLRDHPQLGSPRNDIARDLRLFPVGNYLILFRALDDGVEIVRILHGARKIDELL